MSNPTLLGLKMKHETQIHSIICEVEFYLNYKPRASIFVAM